MKLLLKANRKTVEFRGGLAEINQNDVLWQYMEVESEIPLNRGRETLWITFTNETAGEHSHEILFYEEENVYKLLIPEEIIIVPGEWSFQIFVREYSTVDPTKYKQSASNVYTFNVPEGLPRDVNGNRVTNATIGALYNQSVANVQDSEQYASQALEHAENALVSERNAEQSELNAEKAKEASLGYSNTAKAHADNALISEANAATSADDAKTAEENAETAKGDAETAKNAAIAAREAAEIFSATAQTHANNASTDATAAANSATTAQESAKEAKIYAIRAEEALENVGNFIPGELGEDGKFYPFDKDTGQLRTTALAAPSAGVVYFDLLENKLYTWDSASNAYILQADLNATGGGGSLDPSVLADYVKKTDYASHVNAGVIMATPTYGSMVNSGYLQTAKANKDEILAKGSGYKPIVPNTLDYAVKVGITTNTETLTDEEQTSACDWLGALKKNTNTTAYSQIYAKSIDGSQTMFNITNTSVSETVALRTSKGTVRTKTPENDEDATNKQYVDALQKFTHYITIGTTEGDNLINVSLRITNNDNTSLAIEGRPQDFSLLAQAIYETANGAVSANGTIQSASALTHLVLRAISSDGSTLKLEVCDVNDLSSVPDPIEISGAPYMLIDNVI